MSLESNKYRHLSNKELSDLAESSLNNGYDSFPSELLESVVHRLRETTSENDYTHTLQNSISNLNEEIENLSVDNQNLSSSIEIKTKAFEIFKKEFEEL